MSHSEKELIEEIHRLADGDEPPSLSDLKERGKYNKTTYYNHFGSWNKAVESAGYDSYEERDTNPQKIPQNELINEIHRLADGDEPPSLSDLEERGKYNNTPYYNHFGSWNNAVEAAGYNSYEERNTSPPNKISQDELINEIHRLADGDVPPSIEEMTKNGTLLWRRLLVS